MIKTIWRYIRDEVYPRYPDILKGAELWLSIVAATVFGVYGHNLLISDAKNGEVISGILTYASIAIGFCLTALTIVLTLPNEKFLNMLVTSKPEKKKFNAYSDLLFVFSWTAVCHWLIIFSLIASVVMLGPDGKIINEKAVLCDRLIVGFTTFISFYGFFQFLITLITLAQVARLFTQSLKG